MPDNTIISTPFLTDEEILDILQGQLAIRAGVGYVVGLIDTEGRERVIACGDPGPGMLALDGDSVFEIGSITKTFTGTLLADLVLRGDVDLDTPIRHYLPERIRIPSYNGKEITLLHLATHTSGLPGIPTNIIMRSYEDPYSDYTTDLMLQFLADYELTREIGSLWEYSNLGVALLGYILELRSGMRYEELLTERILTPLGMTMSGITLSPAMSAHLALGHDQQGNVASPWHLGAMVPAGALHSTVIDILRYARANLLTDETPLGRAMQFAQQSRPLPEGRWSKNYGLTWVITDSGYHHWHTGGTGGYRTILIIRKDQQWAVVILGNTNDELADIAWHLVDRNVALTPTPIWKPREAIPITAEELAPYPGEYIYANDPSLGMDAGHAIQITLDGEGLIYDSGNWGKFSIYAVGEDEFCFRKYPVTITFQRNESGEVTGLVRQHESQEITAEKRTEYTTC